MKNKEGQCVLITGGTRGLGKAVSLKYLEHQWKVIINYKENIEEADNMLKEINQYKNIELFKADISVKNDVENMIEEIIKKYEKIDVLINNAGITKDNILIKQSDDEWDNIVSVNLKGMFNVTQSVVKYMLKNENGHIINISSMAGIRGSYGQTAYSASKAGVVGFSKTLARELGQRNIKVNVVLPGLVLTDMAKKISEEKINEKTMENCLGRLNKPKDVADFVYFLSQCENISGQVFNIDSRIY